ncbi:MAG: lipopolysaccharide heptosyltransferase I [Vicinamibacterales bacterium]
MTSALPHDARVLVVRMGALGDIVHALPVLAAIRAHRPDVAVDWLVDARYAGVLRLVEGLSRLVIVRANDDGADDRAIRFRGTGGMLRALGFLRRQGYAAAIDLQGLIKSALFARASGARRVLGFDRAALREPLAASAYTETVPVDDRGHVVHKNLAMLAPLDVPSLGLVFPWAPIDSRVVDAVAADPRVAAAGGFVLLNGGAAWENKRWPPERFGALAAAIAARHGLPSVVAWGPGEESRAAAVVAASQGQAFASPPTALHDVLALARAAKLCVSGDTGPLHLAASVGTPLVALFGPTRPERNGPFRVADVSVSRATECVCFHKRQCLRGAPCIDRIEVAEVLDACTRRLTTESAA